MRDMKVKGGLATCSVDMRMRTFQKLTDYLVMHEDDIAECINDFDDLRGIFFDIFRIQPQNINQKLSGNKPLDIED